MLGFGGNRLSVYGTKISYDTEWSGPLNVKRKAENIPFAIAYYLFVALWVGVATYAMTAGDARDNDFYHESEDFVFKEGWTIAIVFPLAIFTSILFLCLLRIAAKPLVYGIIGLIFVVLFGLVLVTGIMLFSPHTEGLLGWFIVAVVLLIAFLVLFFVKYRFVPVICELVREGAKAVLAFPSMFLYSLCQTVLVLSFSIFNISLFYTIDSIGSEDDYPAHLTFCHSVNGLALVWINCHLFAFFKVSASGAYGTWYWTTNKKDVPRFTALRFIYIALRYHIGPTAFGSLVILVCYALQLLIYTFSSSSNDETPGAYECCMTCCRTALYCVKVVVEAVTGMAYIRIGHHGSGFVDAARASFGVFKRNYAKIIILSRITTALCIFIKLMIVILSLLLFWGLLSSQSVKLEERLGTLFLLGLCIYIVVNAELRLLQIAIENMFLCVLEDYEMNSGSQRSYHMSKKLKELVIENRLE
ncbi:CTL-like protein 2 [Trichogramma pretiosum]|uniref:CTL-like protein 2 n=1 Tax=Trichogramma pretiosum TaxID=7493 RepID=UPI000C71A523|nr:CTL-like protein 2 [Trichogramma pretiosum]